MAICGASEQSSKACAACSSLSGYLRLFSPCLLPKLHHLMGFPPPASQFLITLLFGLCALPFVFLSCPSLLLLCSPNTFKLLIRLSYGKCGLFCFCTHHIPLQILNFGCFLPPPAMLLHCDSGQLLVSVAPGGCYDLLGACHCLSFHLLSPTLTCSLCLPLSLPISSAPSGVAYSVPLVPWSLLFKSQSFLMSF